MRALLCEIDLAAERFPARRYDTVFVGGGTPSLLPAEDMERICEALRARFTIAQGAEVTLECNPGSVDAGRLAAYRRAGINRLSFGLQSANDALLRSIGRIHDYAQFEHGFHMAKQAGFSNINVDILYGLPGQSEADYLDTVARVAALLPTHISAYSLIVEEGTPLYGAVRAGETLLPDDDAVYDMQAAGRAALAALGYAQYEISNYALAGQECRHNINYWENGEYLGLGLAAHAAMVLAGWRRWNNTADLEAYIAKTARGELPIERMQRIERKEEMFECVMLGLRMTRGLSRAAFAARFGQDALEAYPEAAEALRALGYLEVTQDALRLTEAGLDMQNSALLYFMED